MSEKIGEYIRKKVRAQLIEDKDIAEKLDLTVSAVRKIYLLDDIHINRVIEFCKILNEDLIMDFYYKKGALRKFHKKADDQIKEQTKSVELENIQLKKTIEQLQDHIATQKALLEALTSK